MRRVRVTSSSAIGALATLDVLVAAMTDAVADKLRLISLIGSWSWGNIQGSVDDSLEFGVAHSDYSAAEVEECLESAAAIDLGDKVAQEQANRLVRSIGIISNEAGAASAGSFNDGKPVRTKLNWLLSAGDTLNVWVRNGSGTVFVTGSAIIFSGNLWVKD